MPRPSERYSVVKYDDPDGGCHFGVTDRTPKGRVVAAGLTYEEACRMRGKLNRRRRDTRPRKMGAYNV